MNSSNRVRLIFIPYLVALLVAFSMAMWSGKSHAATVSRVTSFTDGSILFASDLNNEFNNLVNGVNNISNDNITANASIDPSKIAATIAGDGIGRDGTTGVLKVNTDGTTLTTSSDNVIIATGGVATINIASAAVTGIKLNNAAFDNSTLELSGVTVKVAQVKDSGIVTAKIADTAVTWPKHATRITATSVGVGDVAISASSGAGAITSSTSFVDITNLSVTINDTASPVRLFLMPDGSGTAGVISTTSSCFLQFTRDASSIAIFTVFNGAIPQGAFEYIDTPATGVHTYKAQYRCSSGSIGATQTKLVAYEL